MKKFIKYFNKFSWIPTITLGIIVSETYSAFTKEWWLSTLIFAYGIILGVFQEKGRNSNE